MWEALAGFWKVVTGVGERRMGLGSDMDEKGLLYGG
jgi:hypothetical protein